MYSLDFTGLCSHNQLNIWISALVLFVLIHAIWEILILLDFNKIVDYASMITDVWVYMFIFGVYPLLISILSTTLLVHNLLFDPSYPVMCVWHRNSIINLIQTITFSSIIIDCFCRYLDNQDDITDREKVLDVFRPFFILCILILTMVSQTFDSLFCC